ncbi:Fur family transcriptional regulator [Paenibacillus yanchengensis]|uniref:Fur family transcriptional regulator n=1 Tax=Paenibacillus yanchengensis TaxID=2035833 RepID=A0ABW4YFH9_9BACL
MSISTEIDKVKRSLMENGYKLTTQREIIVRVLLEHERDHLSAEDVYMLVKQKFPEIGLATVYRTLELLAELNIVAKMNFGDGVARFDLRGEDHEHMHHHLICDICGALEEIKEDWLTSLEEKLEKEFGFKVHDHRLDFIGTFNECEKGNCKRDKSAV